MKSLEGHLLVASPHLLDPNFVRAVILLIQHTDQGALGVVLNRPIDKIVKDLWKEIGEQPCECEQPLHLGGPVSGPLMALHSHKRLAEMKIGSGVFFAASKDNLEELVQQRDHAFRLFVGHAGWGSGQLEDELKQGAWLTTPATAAYVFYEGDDLWKTVAGQIGSSLLSSALKVKNIPDDPSMN